MSVTTFAIFAFVYLMIAALTWSMPLVSAFFVLCSGMSALKAYTFEPATVRRSAFAYR